jgi:cysteine desulfurase
MRTIFLDHQSTTPVLPQALEAMRPYFSEQFGVPASQHQHGLRARDALDHARTQVAGMINSASADEIIFTSSGTEAVNLAIKGTAFASQSRGKHIVLTEIDHPAVQNSMEFLQTQGFTATRVKVDSNGGVDPESIRAAITDQTILVSVQHANHDIGTIEPIRQISAITNERGIPLFVDAVASAGWLSITMCRISVCNCSPFRPIVFTVRKVLVCCIDTVEPGS